MTPPPRNMVNTRLSQANQKRRRSFSEASSESKAIKFRKIARRRVATPDGQLLEEQREASLGGSQGVRSQEVHPSVKNAIEFTNSTKSRRSRHSLPVSLETPANIRTEPLDVAVARVNEHRRRQTEGVPLEFNVADIYINPEDLDLDASQIMTPKISTVVRTKPTPISITPRPSPNTSREDKISEYEKAIRLLTDQKAELAAKVQILELGIHSLGFRDAEVESTDIFAAIRTTFDLVRAQEEEMDLGLSVQRLDNEELLRQQPNIVRGLLLDIDNYACKLDEIENLLVFTDAQYKGVLVKLAEREERSTELELQLEKLDRHLKFITHNLTEEKNTTLKLEGENETLSEQLTARENELKNLHSLSQKQGTELNELRSTCNDLMNEVKTLREAAVRLEKGYMQHIADVEGDRDERLGFMAEELDQEHDYRTIAEKDIAKKDAAYTALQIDFQKVREDLDNLKEQNDKANESLNLQKNKLQELQQDLTAKIADNQGLQHELSELKVKAQSLEEDIAFLHEQRDQNKLTIDNQAAALQSAEEHLASSEDRLQQANIEINRLRADVFGAQKEREQIVSELHVSAEKCRRLSNEITMKSNSIEKLEGNIEALNKAMEDLVKEKDAVINAKNAKLEETLATIDEQAKTMREQAQEISGQAWQITQKETDIQALRKENLRFMADRDRLQATLALREKDLRTLKQVLQSLITDAEKDEIKYRERASQKAELVQVANSVLSGISAEQKVGTLTRESTDGAHVVKKKRSLRDSGYVGSDIDEELELIDAEREIV
ncbi:uncharacterized protein PV09_02033 [Verruconis gallopava]|uniref:Uncharacterized protein n=1 Tax=Verruconis gallopava TaxID=253628 RepID=A0A0D2B7D7_9PEZI|nr:uncharacterized protein PV09_02033 [Verruconis gallopava]KIW07164.1 hypothetical protein PV09_02033 [Verruconis gallopava]